MDEHKKPSRLGLEWLNIAKAMSLQVIAPASIVLPSGKRIEADALLLEFGGDRGMVLVSDYGIIRSHADELVAAGYGFSTLSEPRPNAEFDLDLSGLPEILGDWGWSGDPAKRPDWLIHPAPEEEEPE
jgi:hypothetical protein